MEALKKLAETNLLISDAKNALFKLRDEETAYLSEREKKTLDRIQKMFDESEELLNQTKGNYSELSALLNNISDLSRFIVEMQGNFGKMIADFDERDVLWQQKVALKEKSLTELARKIQIDQAVIASEKKNILADRKNIAEQNQKINDKWAEIERELKRLKEK